jgi:hypothetical protein
MQIFSIKEFELKSSELGERALRFAALKWKQSGEYYSMVMEYGRTDLEAV